MTEELTYDGALTAIKNYQMARGDTRKLSFAHEWAAANVNEARLWAKNSSGTVSISLSKESNSAQWTLTTDYEGTLTIRPTDSEELATGDYTYAIELRDASTPVIVYTPVKGTLTIFDDVVNDYDGSGELSWDSRASLVALYTSLASCHEFSYLTADAITGASSITVADGDIFTNGDTVRIGLDAGTYDETTVTVIGDTLTLGDVLTGDASKFNAVRKV